MTLDDVKIGSLITLGHLRLSTLLYLGPLGHVIAGSHFDADRVTYHMNAGEVGIVLACSTSTNDVFLIVNDAVGWCNITALVAFHTCQ